MTNLTLEEEFEKMAHQHHFSKFGEILGDLRAEWANMPAEHRDWARKLSSEIPDLSKKLGDIDGSDAQADKARAKAAKEIEFREAELVAFFQAPSETMAAGPKKGLPTRREVYKKSFADRDSKTADKAGSIASWAVGIAVGVGVATMGHHAAWQVPHAIGEIVPAAKAMHVFGLGILAATKGAQAGFAELFKKAKEAAFELGDWQRVADDPALEAEKAPDVLPAKTRAEWEAKAQKLNELSRQALPADKLELQQVKGEKVIAGLEAAKKWRESVSAMPSATGLSIAAAIKEQKKAIAKQKASPEWATAEFKSLVEFLGDKDNQRSVGSIGSAEWRQWHGLRAASGGNPVVAAANASIRPVIKVLNLETAALGLLDRIKARRQNAAPPAPREPYSPQHWVRPPRAK